MRRVDVLVTLSVVHKQPLSVPPWEVPILERIHPKVEVVGESRCDLRVPDPRDEWARLHTRYGKDKETLVPRVEQVYGSDIGGLRALTEAMSKDLLEQEELDGKAAAEAAAAGQEPPAGDTKRKRTRD